MRQKHLLCILVLQDSPVSALCSSLLTRFQLRCDSSVISYSMSCSSSTPSPNACQLCAVPGLVKYKPPVAFHTECYLPCGSTDKLGLSLRARSEAHCIQEARSSSFHLESYSDRLWSPGLFSASPPPEFFEVSPALSWVPHSASALQPRQYRGHVMAHRAGLQRHRSNLADCLSLST